MDTRLGLRISVREKRAFEKAADAQGISLSQWLRLSAWQTINEHGGQVKLVALDK